MRSPAPPADIQDVLREAARLIRQSRYLTAFTGAGISVESGIPPFRGPGGLWSTYDPRMLELGYFLAHPEKAWPVIREIFYDHFGQAKPNRAHEVLAAWERDGWAAPEAPGGRIAKPRGVTAAVGSSLRPSGVGARPSGAGARPSGASARPSSARAANGLDFSGGSW